MPPATYCTESQDIQLSWGVTADVKAAVKWFGLAADQGHASGQYNPEDMYENGKGVAKDRAMAVSWFQKSARQESYSAQQALKRLGETL